MLTMKIAPCERRDKMLAIMQRYRAANGHYPSREWLSVEMGVSTGTIQADIRELCAAKKLTMRHGKWYGLMVL